MSDDVRRGSSDHCAPRYTNGACITVGGREAIVLAGPLQPCLVAEKGRPWA